MPQYQISTHSGRHVEVAGGNWLVALGLGLDALGVVANIARLACEVLPGNTVIVRDVRTGGRFVVQPLPDSPGEPLAELVGHNQLEEDGTIFAMGEDPDHDTEPCADEASKSGRREESAHVDPAGLTTSTGPEADALSRSGHGIHPPQEDISHSAGEVLALPEDRRDLRIAALIMRLDDAATTADAWRLALEGARRVCGAESGAALHQEADGALRFLFAVGPRAHEVRGRRLPPGKGIAGFCTQRDVGLLITEPNHDPRFFSGMDQATGYTTTAVLAVPVTTGFEMLGCLELLNAPSGFRHRHLEQVSALAVGLAARLIRDPD